MTGNFDKDPLFISLHLIPQSHSQMFYPSFLLLLLATYCNALAVDDARHQPYRRSVSIPPTQAQMLSVLLLAWLLPLRKRWPSLCALDPVAKGVSPDQT